MTTIIHWSGKFTGTCTYIICYRKGLKQENSNNTVLAQSVFPGVKHLSLNIIKHKVLHLPSKFSKLKPKT